MSKSPAPDSSDEFWLFGYGSLIWKPPPHYDLRIPGHIKGYIRRFWQASEDHRGTPASPGRVVTLITQSYYHSTNNNNNNNNLVVGDTPSPSPASPPNNNNKKNNEDDAMIVQGVAYRIPAAHVEDVKAYLDIREINGYSIVYTTFYPSPSTAAPRREEGEEEIRRCMVYIGLPSNPQFLGVQAPEEVAGVIAGSEGPSGRNDEYLFMLERGLRELEGGGGLGDEHVGDLARRVRRLLDRDGGAGGEEEAADTKMRVETELGGKPAEEMEKTVVASMIGD